MTIITNQPIHYAHARGGTAPATFGQRHMWSKLAIMGPHTHLYNIVQVAPVADGMAVAEVRDVIRTLVLRHESLRTRYRQAADGSLWQCLPASDEIMCEIWEGAGEDPSVVGPRAERELGDTHFDLVGSAPVRALIGTVHGCPKVAMVAVSHIAADMLSARLVRQDLVELLAAREKGEPDPELPPRRQPLDQAAFEATLDAATVSRSLASWRKRLTEAPPRMFGVRAEPPVPREFLRATLTSEALTLAADALGHRYRVNTTAVVVLAAKAMLLAHYAGADRCALQMPVGNRIYPELTWAVGCIRHHALAVVDVRAASFAQVVRRTWSAWMQAQRTRAYDPGAVDKVRTEVEAERGVALTVGTYFNDLRTRTRPHSERPAAARILAAADTTRFAWEGTYAADYVEFHLRLEDAAAGRTTMTAFFDTAAVPGDRVRELMFGIERLLVWQATAGVTAAGPLTSVRLAEITGIPGFQPPTAGWARIDGCWVDLAAARELLALAADGAPCAVRESGDGRLIGYVCGPFTPKLLHERCVALLTDPRFRCRNAMTPRHYVVCAPGPDDWPDRPVLAQGGGRS